MIIYLATPYSDPDPTVREYRFQCVNEVALDLIAQGYLVFSPISQTHPMEVTTGICRGFDFWRSYNFGWLDVCDVLYVLKLRGWSRSIGVGGERAHAATKTPPMPEVLIDYEWYKRIRGL